MSRTTNHPTAINHPHSGSGKSGHGARQFCLARACLQLFGLSLRRQFFSRQTLICFVLTGIGCVIVIAWSMGKSPSVKSFVEMILMPIYGDMMMPTVYGTFLLPMYAVCYGASSIGSEREEQTLIYTLTTPLPRPAIYLVKFCASSVLSIGWTMGGLVTLSALGDSAVRATISRLPIAWLGVSPMDSHETAHWGFEALRQAWPAVLLASFCYSSLFHALGAMFRRGTIISLAYAFFLELLLGNMPGIVKRVAVSFYYVCMIVEAGQSYGIKLPMSNDLFLPVASRVATIVLITVSSAIVLLGTITFTRREFRDVG